MYLDDLNSIVDQLVAMRGRFVLASGELTLRNDDQAKFSGLEAEARALIREALSPGSEFITNIIFAVGSDSPGFLGGPSHACITKVEEQVRAAVRAVERQARTAPVLAARAASKPAYVNAERIFELQRFKSQKWDYSKLIQLCAELNIANEHSCHHAVAMLVRSILDHVPPVFGLRSFQEVASNHGGPSFKKSMEHLQKGLRNIADGHLHSPIRQRESLPTDSQVDFRAGLDQLLAEVIRIA